MHTSSRKERSSSSSSGKEQLRSSSSVKERSRSSSSRKERPCSPSKGRHGLIATRDWGGVVTSARSSSECGANDRSRETLAGAWVLLPIVAGAATRTGAASNGPGSASSIQPFLSGL